MRTISVFLISFLFSTLAYSSEMIRSTPDDRKTVTLTIYNNNIAFVSETRDVELPLGGVSLVFTGIPSLIIPDSVQLVSQGRQGVVSVLEQRYEYDLQDRMTLRKKYIGNKVILHYRNPATHEDEIKDATIIAIDERTVLRIDDEITFDFPGYISFPPHPEGLYEKPAIIWQLQNKIADSNALNVTYLTRGLSWKADYVMKLSPDEDKADLLGRATIHNSRRIDYKNARIKLAAGEINLEPESKGPQPLHVRAPESDVQFREKRFFEFYLYELKRSTDLQDSVRKQISFKDISSIPVVKKFFIKGSEVYYFSQYRKGVTRGAAGIMIEFSNDISAGLGTALPAGVVRIYKYDRSGDIQFIGEDSIEHTAENEVVRVKTGKAFDIVSERKQTDWIRIAEGVFESTFEIKIRNHKDEDI
ncbi:MAG: hypothetical protein V3V59_04005, partial [Thermodesulfovibrionales bacterium]